MANFKPVVPQRSQCRGPNERRHASSGPEALPSGDRKQQHVEPEDASAKYRAVANSSTELPTPRPSHTRGAR